MSVPEDEIVNIRRSSNFLLRKLDKVLFVFTQEVLHATVLTTFIRPCMRQGDRPPRMNAGKQKAQKLTVKNSTEKPERNRFIGQSVSVSDKELLAGNFRNKRFEVNYQSAFVLKVIGEPDVVVANEKVDFHA
ncbi:hypothetical protein SDC9_172087 [bioreactor metagenome]|uniref:Uncharacterized protein n=1 Tax=bioreactor metagenome TaxID=1076179 RepID=A0A645GDC9_9ZZZZ